MTKIKKKVPARKPAAKAKIKTAPKKVSKPLLKAKAVPAKAQAKPVAKPAHPPKAIAQPVAKPMPPKAPVTKAAVQQPQAVNRPATPAVASPLRAAVVAAQVAKPVGAAGLAVTPAAPRKLAFKIGELVVYPAHGVGKVVQIEEQEIAGARLELFIVDFEKEKLRLKVPTNRAEQKGMRRLSDRSQIDQALKILKGRARIKRTMWSRRAQEYDAKINSGDLVSVAEVVRDLYRSERQPEQSYSERQLFEQALERLAREIAAVKRIDDDQAIKELEDYLVRNAKRTPVAGEKVEEDVPSEEAA